MVAHILVVDDDLEIRRLLARYLREQGFRVSLAGSRAECEAQFDKFSIDLVVLDVMLPDGSGLDICRSLRASLPNIAIVLVTALKEEVDRIVGLELGADDYLGKPFSPRELVARMRAVLRRATPLATVNSQIEIGIRYRFDGFVADLATRAVTSKTGEQIDLTGAEFQLLQVFLDRSGRVLSRDQLLDLTQGREASPFDRSIDVLVSRLRRKFRDAGAHNLLETIRNSGYQLTARVQTIETSQ